MNITINRDLEKFVHAKMGEGQYGSASDVVAEALELLAAHDAKKRRKMTEMDAFIQVGEDSAARGEFVTEEELEADLDALFVELKAQYG